MLICCVLYVCPLNCFVFSLFCFVCCVVVVVFCFVVLVAAALRFAPFGVSFSNSRFACSICLCFMFALHQ